MNRKKAAGTDGTLTEMFSTLGNFSVDKMAEVRNEI